LDSNYTIVCEELLSLLNSHPMSQIKSSVADGGTWKVINLWKEGEKLHDPCKLCPKTVELIESCSKYKIG